MYFQNEIIRVKMIHRVVMSENLTTLDKILSLTAAVLSLLIFLTGCAPQETIKSRRDDRFWCLEKSVLETPHLQQLFML